MSKPYTLINDDCIVAMRKMPDLSVDSIVCDPPAGIAFMGKLWDKDKGGRSAWVGWLAEVMREAIRVLKPGGHALVWALPRTSHWTAWALEDAGFEVRDAVLHCFGTGFPKSQDISKFIDKSAGVEREVVGKHPNPAGNKPGTASLNMGVHGMPSEANITAPATDAAKKWAGWGSALKPSQEIWWLCRKPLDGTLAANTLKHGVGGLNIYGCRVGVEGGTRAVGSSPNNNNVYGDGMGGQAYEPAGGRWPANLLLSHSPSCVHLDTADDTDLWACVPGCPVRAMDAQSGIGFSSVRKPTGKDDRESKNGSNMVIRRIDDKPRGANDAGGASRFFMRFDPNDAPFIYQAKANTKDRNAGVERNHHPTVKSTSLMAYLCRLVTPPGGVVLDPFMGSGSTGVAALREGFRFIGIEREQEYFDIAQQRINSIKDLPKVSEKALSLFGGGA